VCGNDADQRQPALRGALGIAGQRKDLAGAATGAGAESAPLRQDDILERLFESKGVGDAAWRRTLLISADGQRFLLNPDATGPTPPAPPITTVINWTATLKK